MGEIPMLPKDAVQSEKEAPYPPDDSLPVFYMSDYSVTGLLVERFQHAVKLLEENGFSMIDEDCGRAILFEDVADLQNVFQLFKTHEVDYGFADIVGQIYQG